MTSSKLNAEEQDGLAESGGCFHILFRMQQGDARAAKRACIAPGNVCQLRARLRKALPSWFCLCGVLRLSSRWSSSSGSGGGKVRKTRKHGDTWI